MAERRVGVRVSVTGSGNEFRDLATDATKASAAIRSIPNRVTVRADSSGLATLEQRARQAERSSSLLVDSIALLAPTLSPLSAVAIAGLGGLANQAAVAGMALGTTVLGVAGVVDGVKALEAARLEPTADNLRAAREALAAMPQDAAEFARYLHDLRPVLDQLQGSAAGGGMLDGFTDGIDLLLTRLPQVDSIIRDLSAAQGELARNAGASLAGPEFDEFFDMLDRTAKPTLVELGQTIGNLAQTGANLWTAFEPLNRGFSTGLRDVTASLAEWSATTDFTDFIDYVRESTPQVLDALGSLAGMFGAIVEAGAPLGGPTLAAITSIADALGAVADSPAGPALLGAAAGFAALNRALTIQTKLRDSLAGGLIFGRGTSSAQSQVAGLTAVTAGVTKQATAVRSLPAAYREVSAAQRGLIAAERARAEQAARTRQAQTAFIPTADRRQAVRDYSASLRGVTDAERRLATAQTTRAAAFRSTAATAGKAAGGAAALGFAMSGMAEDTGFANTAMLGLTGSMLGPWGAAAGTSIGLAMDLAGANDALAASLDAANRAAGAGDIGTLASQLRTARSEFAELAGMDVGLTAGGGGLLAMFTGPSDEEAAKIRETQDAYEELKDVHAEVGRAMGRDFGATVSLRELERVARDAGPAMRDLGISWDDLRNMSEGERFAAAQAIANWRQEADLATGSAREFTAALAAMDRVLTGRAGLRDYEAALDGIRASLKENGQTLDITTAKGRANQAALDNIAASAVSAAESMRPLQRQRFMAGAAREFIDAAQAMGKSEEAAIRLAAKMRLIPREKATRMIVESQQAELRARAVQRLVDEFGLTKAQATALLDDRASGKLQTVQRLADRFGITRAQAAALLNDLASGKLNSILSLLNSVDGRTAHTTTTHDIITRYKVVRSVTDALPDRTPQAAGGLWMGNVQRYADGGMDIRNGHRPHIAKAGTWRVFAEEETGGEAYIPLRNDWRRPRARAIAQETARLLGGRIEWNAAGALRGPSATPAPPRLSVAAPNVSVGGPAVRVFIDGNEVRAVVRSEMDAQDAWEGGLLR